MWRREWKASAPSSFERGGVCTEDGAPSLANTLVVGVGDLEGGERSHRIPRNLSEGVLAVGRTSTHISVDQTLSRTHGEITGGSPPLTSVARWGVVIHRRETGATSTWGSEEVWDLHVEIRIFGPLNLCGQFEGGYIYSHIQGANTRCRCEK